MGSDHRKQQQDKTHNNFNPRSPDGERLSPTGVLVVGLDISIHAPRMGSDPTPAVHQTLPLIFQSTLPGWGATVLADWVEVVEVISIHAPRMGSDLLSSATVNCSFSISIHAPRMGSDLSANRSSFRVVGFQSTLPGWGATGRTWRGLRRWRYFNPRSPDGERLSMSARRRAYCHNFNPRSPDGERRMTMAEIMPYFNISIHAPRMGSDSLSNHSCCVSRISIHAPRMGSDTRRAIVNAIINISIHAPRMGSDVQREHALAHIAVISIHAPRMGSDAL